jgi:hypothetical protein
MLLVQESEYCNVENTLVVKDLFFLLLNLVE